MASEDDLKGPIIRWEDYGPEGWQPRSFATVHEALYAEHYSRIVLTTVIEPTSVTAAIDAAIKD